MLPYWDTYSLNKTGTGHYLACVVQLLQSGVGIGLSVHVRMRAQKYIAFRICIFALVTFSFIHSS